MMVGGSGPMIAPFFLGLGLPKKKLIATKAMCQAVVQFLKIPAFMTLVGVSFEGQWDFLLLLTAATWLGTWVGTRVIDRLHDQLYERILKATLTLLGVIFLYRGMVG
jgi:uncharacterized membrane protein YfcA